MTYPLSFTVLLGIGFLLGAISGIIGNSILGAF